MHFNSAEEARQFLDQLQSGLPGLLSQPKEQLLTSYMSGISEVQKDLIKSYGVDNGSNKTEAQNDDNEGNDAPGSGPGSGYISQRYFPWNKVNVYVQWDDNNKITTVQSYLSGVTVGIGWTQLGYDVVSTLPNGVVVIKITYSTSATLYSEGIGNVWQSTPRDAYVAAYGGGCGGTGTNQPFAGIIFGSLKDLIQYASGLSGLK